MRGPKRLFGETGDESWKLDGACRGADPEIFYPKTSSPIAADAAKAICSVCTVREECLEYALNNGEDYGTWGGYTEKERARLKKNSARRVIEVAGV